MWGMYRIEICDCERGSALHLERMLRKKISWAVIRSVSERHLEEELTADMMRPNILFVGVKLRTRSGVSLAAKLREIDPMVRVIFLAGRQDDLSDIFDAAPIGLLVKPFRQEKIYAVLERAIQGIEKESMDFLQLKSREHFFRVRYQEIRYIESDRRYLYIHRQDTSDRVRMKFSELETRLPNYFVRCHQSYMVNLYELAFLDGSSLVLVDGMRFPVSRSRREQTRERVEEFWGRAKINRNIESERIRDTKKQFALAEGKRSRESVGKGQSNEE